MNTWLGLLCCADNRELFANVFKICSGLAVWSGVFRQTRVSTVICVKDGYIRFFERKWGVRVFEAVFSCMAKQNQLQSIKTHKKV